MKDREVAKHPPVPLLLPGDLGLRVGVHLALEAQAVLVLHHGALRHARRIVSLEPGHATAVGLDVHVPADGGGGIGFHLAVQQQDVPSLYQRSGGRGSRSDIHVGDKLSFHVDKRWRGLSELIGHGDQPDYGGVKEIGLLCDGAVHFHIRDQELGHTVYHEGVALSRSKMRR